MNKNLVNLGSSWVNLDHVRKIEFPDRERVEVTWSSGELETFRETHAHDLFKEPYHIVPAQPGFELLMFWLDAESEGMFERSPIIAWRIDDSKTGDYFGDESLTAIAQEMNSREAMSNMRVGVRCPDGTMRHHADGRQWPSEAEWLKWCEERKEEYQRTEATRKLRVVESKGANHA
jgi:hypothetical protein